MNNAQYYFDLSLYQAVRSAMECNGQKWTAPVSRNYMTDGYVWPQEVQAINCLTAAGKPIPTYPVIPNPNPARQQAISRWAVDEKLWATALTQCQISLPKPDLQSYIDSPTYVWPHVAEAKKCPANNPA